MEPSVGRLAEGCIEGMTAALRPRGERLDAPEVQWVNVAEALPSM
jgi:hypothetical protein